ncbi:hypothetical protein [Leifsonia sp. NPDC058248]|uniref:hypothetical protein n=1 Tax=Leifsonia sp. NPDC058248 TaxID=3346402 RepID=UPI0036D81373
MTATTPPSDDWELPESWTDGARELFLGVIDQRPDLAGAELGSLEQAASLHASAERLDAVAQDAGMIATGSTGQTIVHPAVVEARLARTASAAILSRLVPPTSGPKTSSQRGRDAARARYSK